MSLRGSDIGPSYGPVMGDLQRQGFAFAVSTGLLMANVAPVSILVQLAMDADVVFWIGRYGLLALVVIPYLVMYYCGFTYKIYQGRSSGRLALLIAMVLPPLLLALLAAPYVISAWYVRTRLTSQDCGQGDWGLTDRGCLQEAYEDARLMYDTCQQRLVGDNDGQPLPRRALLQTCSEWVEGGYSGLATNTWLQHRWSSPTGKNHREMEYLAYAEAKHVCGGFCHRGPMLWNSPEMEGQSACAPMIADKFRVVEHLGLQALVSALVVVVLSIIGFSKLQPFLFRLGFG